MNSWNGMCFCFPLFLLCYITCTKSIASIGVKKAEYFTFFNKNDNTTKKIKEVHKKIVTANPVQLVSMEYYSMLVWTKIRLSWIFGSFSEKKMQTIISVQITLGHKEQKRLRFTHLNIIKSKWIFNTMCCNISVLFSILLLVFSFFLCVSV